ncbi:MAG TPA: T9SS type A sorting domain-containing protein [Flavobacteriales bacterium]|jgi:hypothetical protein|nr:T9SS type A sorting domain-containing protein [Flavobacteriales bacterium]
MRRTTILLTLVLAVLQCFAQSWCAPGAQWYHNYAYTSWGDVGYVETHYTGDVLFSDSVCQEFEYTEHIYSYQSNNSFEAGPFTMLTTTSPGIVHIWTGTEFDTLFHFSAVPGDHWQAPGDWTFTETRIEVTDTGHVALEGRSVRYQTIDLSFDDVVWVSDTVYEGIGPVQMYLNIPISYQVMIDGGYGGLRCYTDEEVDINRVEGPCEIALGVVSMELEGAMDIFPNPCTTQATVDWPSGTPVEQCTLTDASGRVVRQWNPRTLTAAQHTFSVVDLSSGMYSLQVRAKDGVRSGRILVAP